MMALTDPARQNQRRVRTFFTFFSEAGFCLTAVHAGLPLGTQDSFGPLEPVR
jgi:hypothetical protein